METIKTIIGFFCDVNWLLVSPIMLFFFGIIFANGRVKKNVKSNQKLNWINRFGDAVSELVAAMDQYQTAQTNSQADAIRNAKAVSEFKAAKEQFKTTPTKSQADALKNAEDGILKSKEFLRKYGYADYLKASGVFLRCHSRVYLSLNSVNPMHVKIISELEQIKEAFDEWEKLSVVEMPKAFEDGISNLQNEAHDLIKKEEGEALQILNFF